MKLNKFLSQIKSKNLIMSVKRNYGTPVNRWEHHFSNGDAYFEQTHTYIERKNYSQPFDNKMSHPKPPVYFNIHQNNDFRYNVKYQNLPMRHTNQPLFLKLYNRNDINAVMHGNEWHDMQPDYQTEQPMDSNHYIQANGQQRAFYMFLYVFIFGFGKFSGHLI